MHLATDITSTAGSPGPCCGRTVWGEVSGTGETGLAWDWVEIARGVVAMVDPMAVMTNMRLLDGDGDVLPATEAALHINQLVRKIPWQQQVSRMLSMA